MPTGLKEVHKLLAAGKRDAAIDLLRSLATANPDFPVYERRLRELAGAPAGSGRPALLKLLEEARAQLTHGRFELCIETCRQVIAADPTIALAHRIAEQACIEAGQPKAANAFFLSQPAAPYPEKAAPRGRNPALPPQFEPAPVIGAGNDYRHILERASLFAASGAPYTKKASIVMPVYNRAAILANTLAALTHQTYPAPLIEVIVVDDGSSDDVLAVVRKYESRLNLVYARQRDDGYRLAEARNLGLRLATGDAIVFMDADILPCPSDIESYLRVLHVADDAVLIGHRRYVDVGGIRDDDILRDIAVATSLPDINPDNDVADHRDEKGSSIDWRFPVYAKTRALRDDLWPFTKAAGGNLAMSRRLIEVAGPLDEAFRAWGCEDGEHGYRLYNAGAYFIPMLDVVSLHQEPLGSRPAAPTDRTEEESFRAAGRRLTAPLFADRCPAPTVRKGDARPPFRVPKVSIYIPAHNASRHIVDAVRSCLTQDFEDLEVCICDDGSTDDTVALLESNFGRDKRVRWVSQPNGGIGKATNTAIAMCRGMYIAQLDSDDLLKPGAVRTCVWVLDRRNVDAVYTDCEYIDESGRPIRIGWCGGRYAADWMVTGMIATHFRMLRRRLWARVPRCNEHIKNAVDFDLWMKLAEKGHIEHVHQVLYSYRWHGSNTSMAHRKHQEKNHLTVIRDGLHRTGLDRHWKVTPSNDPVNPRALRVEPVDRPAPPKPGDVVVLIPSCEKYAARADAIRRTWAAEMVRAGFRVLFLRGDDTLPTAVVRGDVLTVPCRDDYESLLLKLVLGYGFLYRHFGFSHVYKIDDDCVVDVEALVGDILPQLAGVAYAGGALHRKGAPINNAWHVGKCSDARFDRPFQLSKAPCDFAKGGYGYFLRRDVLPILMREEDTLSKELQAFVYAFEDLRLAQTLAAREIVPLQLARYRVSHAREGVGPAALVVYDVADAAGILALDRSMARLPMPA